MQNSNPLSWGVRRTVNGCKSRNQVFPPKKNFFLKFILLLIFLLSEIMGQIAKSYQVFIHKKYNLNLVLKMDVMGKSPTWNFKIIGGPVTTLAARPLGQQAFSLVSCTLISLITRSLRPEPSYSEEMPVSGCYEIYLSSCSMKQPVTLWEMHLQLSSRVWPTCCHESCPPRIPLCTGQCQLTWQHLATGEATRSLVSCCNDQ